VLLDIAGGRAYKLTTNGVAYCGPQGDYRRIFFPSRSAGRDLLINTERKKKKI